jgi:hypothetical protein
VIRLQAQATVVRPIRLQILVLVGHRAVLAEAGRPGELDDLGAAWGQRSPSVALAVTIRPKFCS